MLAASAQLIAHIAQRSTSLAWLWLVTRADAQVFGFTSHDRDITHDGVTYVAAQGIDPSALSSGPGLAVSNAEMSAVFNGAAVTEHDLRSGRWDHADVRIRIINWRDTSQGVIKLLRGWLGEASFDGFNYQAELRGFTDLLNAPISVIVTPSCSATLGDAKCTKVLTDYTAAGTVSAVASQRSFTSADMAAATVRLTPSTTGTPPTDYFDKITWLTGANAGLAMEVKTSTTAGVVGLVLPMEGTIAIGDTFNAVARCAKSAAACKGQFDNLLFFRGFPTVPGIDKMVRVGGQ